MLEVHIERFGDYQRNQILDGHKKLLGVLYPGREVAGLSREQENEMVSINEDTVSSLEKTEARAITLVFGLTDGVARTPERVGLFMKITQEEALLKLKSGLSKLSSPGTCSAYKCFLSEPSKAQ